MNILIINNVASMQAITAEALNKIEGVSCKCIVYGDQSKYITQFTSTHSIKSVNRSENLWKYLYYKMVAMYTFSKFIWEADVIHYVWAPFIPYGIDLWMAKLLRKKIYVEFVGSEIRRPSTLFQMNKYYAEVFNNGYEYFTMESNNENDPLQRLFAKVGAIPTVCPEISLYLNRSLFPNFEIYMQRINVNDFEVSYPNPQNTKPIIIHSPSAKHAKGTPFIMKEIEELKKEYDFEFILLHDLPRSKVLEIMKSADIFLDQIILGSYGLATCEAMAYGKPVMCYLMPRVFEAGLDASCPIVNTNPENLRTQLVTLLTNGNLRNSIGKQSRQYVEKYHDADKIAHELVALYKR